MTREVTPKKIAVSLPRAEWDNLLDVLDLLNLQAAPKIRTQVEDEIERRHIDKVVTEGCGE